MTVKMQDRAPAGELL